MSSHIGRSSRAPRYPSYWDNGSPGEDPLCNVCHVSHYPPCPQPSSQTALSPTPLRNQVSSPSRGCHRHRDYSMSNVASTESGVPPQTLDRYPRSTNITKPSNCSMYVNTTSERDYQPVTNSTRSNVWLDNSDRQQDYHEDLNGIRNEVTGIKDGMRDLMHQGN